MIAGSLSKVTSYVDYYVNNKEEPTLCWYISLNLFKKWTNSNFFEYFGG